MERRDTFEQMLAEDTRNDALFYEREEMPSFETVASELDAEEPRQQPLEENHSYRAQNFRITDDHLGEGGAKTKYAFNIAAIQTLKQIEAEERQATPQEQEILSGYVGWGGIPQAYDGNNAQ